jgi:hypothetical protein
MPEHKTYRDAIQVDSTALNAKTQRARILRLLIEARGAWVPLPEIMVCAAQYNARILELRRMGFNVENKTERVNGARHSWFRLVTSSAAPAPKPEPTKPQEMKSWEQVCAERDRKAAEPKPPFQLTP